MNCQDARAHLLDWERGRLGPELHAQVLRSHLGRVLGPENVLVTDVRLMGSLRRAIERARRDLAREGLGSRPIVRRAEGVSPEDGSSYMI